MNYGRYQSAMVTFNGQPVIVGGFGSDSAKTSETFENGSWLKIQNIPIQGTRFEDHSALVVSGKIYTFGERTGLSGADFYEKYSYVFDCYEWKRENGMQKPKYYHRSIMIGGDIYHVGGLTVEGDYGLVERWQVANGGFNKEVFDFQFTSTSLDYPEVFAVDQNFCNFKMCPNGKIDNFDLF